MRNLGFQWLYYMILSFLQMFLSNSIFLWHLSEIIRKCSLLLQINATGQHLYCLFPRCEVIKKKTKLEFTHTCICIYYHFQNKTLVFIILSVLQFRKWNTFVFIISSAGLRFYKPLGYKYCETPVINKKSTNFVFLKIRLFNFVLSKFK